jgi:hypothetical protein
MKLSKAQREVLRALVQGCTLKSHRYLDGTKVYKLHPLDGPAQTVQRPTVDALRAHGLIQGNHKFPAATYLLTNQGREIAAALPDSPENKTSRTESK